MMRHGNPVSGRKLGYLLKDLPRDTMHACTSLPTAVKSRTILLVAGTIILLSIFYTSYQFTVYRTHFHSHLAGQQRNFEQICAATQHHYETFYTSWLKSFIANQQGSIAAFAEQDREKLYTLTLPHYQSLQKLCPDMKIMHFHAPDDRSFLRMHQPELFGDDLSAIRPAVHRANQTRRPLFGYEIGVFGCYYRIIEPVAHNGRHIGVIELGIRIDELVNTLARASGNPTAVFFDSSWWQAASRYEGTRHHFRDHTLIESTPLLAPLLPADFSLTDTAKPFAVNGIHYLALIAPVLLDPFQHPIGGIIALTDISTEIHEKKRFLATSLAVSIGLGLFCIFFLAGNLRKIIGTLQQSQTDQQRLIEDLNREMSSRKEIESALAQSEKTQRHILNGLPDTIYLLDQNGIVTWANEATLRQFPDLVGRPCTFCTGEIPTPENCIARRLSSQQAFHRGIIRRPAGPDTDHETTWESIHIAQRDEHGEPAGTLVVLRDISERIAALRQADKLNRHNKLLLHAAGEGIYGVDRQGRTTFMNPAAERMTGFSEAEMLGSNQHELLHHTRADGTPYPVCDCPVHLTMRTRQPHSVTDELFWKKDGSSFPVEYVVTPVEEEGEVIGAVVLFTDISRRKLLEKQLLHAQKMEAVGRLTSGIAHDFNNLLTTIFGYSEILLREMAEDDPRRQKVGMIQQAGKMAAALTRQLLAFSRRQVLEMRTINLNQVIDGLARMLRRLIGENITLTLNTLQPGCLIRADAGQCEQIIMNLAINAKDAMPKGGTLTFISDIVHLAETKQTGFEEIRPGSYVLMRVIDTGEGMTEEIQKLIFEPFFTTKEMGKGTGLGLATVYGIVKQHNGFIAVTSTPGHGTAFDLYFPLAENQPNDSAILADAALPRGRETILVVDDTATIRQFLRDTLEPLGYTILEAGNGEEALAVADSGESPIDVLLADMVMPGMGGMELARTLQPRQPGMKTLFMTGHLPPEAVAQNIFSESAHLIQKPLSPGQIARQVRAILDRHAS